MKTALREDGILCCQGEDVSGQRLMPDHCIKTQRRLSSWGDIKQAVKSILAPRYRSVLIWIHQLINCWTALSKSGVRVLSCFETT